MLSKIEQPPMLRCPTHSFLASAASNCELICASGYANFTINERAIYCGGLHQDILLRLVNLHPRKSAPQNVPSKSRSPPTLTFHTLSSLRWTRKRDNGTQHGILLILCSEDIAAKLRLPGLRGSSGINLPSDGSRSWSAALHDPGARKLGTSHMCRTKFFRFIGNILSSVLLPFSIVHADARTRSSTSCPD